MSMAFNSKAKKKKLSSKRGQETFTDAMFKSTLGYPDRINKEMIYHQLISVRARLESYSNSLKGPANA